METVIIQFGLMVINLYSAKTQQENGRNPGFQYFCAGICCMGGIYGLINLF